MKNLRNQLLVALGFAILTGSLVLSGSSGLRASSADSQKDVVVVNTAANAVPVQAQGTTNVAGAVQAQQSGPWIVGITGTPMVSIGNTAIAPVLVRDVDNPARRAVQAQAEVILGPGQDGENADILTVPDGKRLVIEQISAHGFAPPGQKLLLSVQTHVAPDLVYRGHILQATAMGAFGPDDMFIANQQVRIYADPPHAVVRLTRADNAGTATAHFVISGYFVDVP